MLSFVATQSFARANSGLRSISHSVSSESTSVRPSPNLCACGRVAGASRVGYNVMHTLCNIQRATGMLCNAPCRGCARERFEFVVAPNLFISFPGPSHSLDHRSLPMGLRSSASVSAAPIRIRPPARARSVRCGYNHYPKPVPNSELCPKKQTQRLLLCSDWRRSVQMPLMLLSH
jgi:hypothetical protein